MKSAALPYRDIAILNFAKWLQLLEPEKTKGLEEECKNTGKSAIKLIKKHRYLSNIEIAGLLFANFGGSVDGSIDNSFRKLVIDSGIVDEAKLLELTAKKEKIEWEEGVPGLFIGHVLAEECPEYEPEIAKTLKDLEQEGRGRFHSYAIKVAILRKERIKWRIRIGAAVFFAFTGIVIAGTLIFQRAKRELIERQRVYDKYICLGCSRITVRRFASLELLEQVKVTECAHCGKVIAVKAVRCKVCRDWTPCYRLDLKGKPVEEKWCKCGYSFEEAEKIPVR